MHHSLGTYSIRRLVVSYPPMTVPYLRAGDTTPTPRHRRERRSSIKLKRLERTERKKMAVMSGLNGKATGVRPGNQWRIWLRLVHLMITRRKLIKN